MYIHSFSIKFGPGVLGGLGAATGMYVNSHYRNRLRLGKFGFIGSFIPIAVLPAIMTTLYNRAFIQPRILLQKDDCPLCLQLRAATMQGALGVVYPTILAPFAAYMVKAEMLNFIVNRNLEIWFVFKFAIRHFTYRLPSIIEEPKALLKIYAKMTRPVLPTLAVVLGLNALVASFLTYRQQLAFAKLQVYLLEKERGERGESIGFRDGVGGDRLHAYDQEMRLWREPELGRDLCMFSAMYDLY